MVQVISLVCLALLRHYALSFGGRFDNSPTSFASSYYDRDIVGKATVVGMIFVTAPILLANVLGDGHSLLSVRGTRSLSIPGGGSFFPFPS